MTEFNTKDISSLVDMRVLTNVGWELSSDLVGRYALVWNGQKYVRVLFSRSRGRNRIIRVTTNSYEDLWLTFKHHLLQDVNNSVEHKRTYSLEEGTRLYKPELPMPVDGKYGISNIENKTSLFMEDGSFIPDNHHRLSDKLELLKQIYNIYSSSLVEKGPLVFFAWNLRKSAAIRLKMFLSLMGIQSKVLSDREAVSTLPETSEEQELYSDNRYTVCLYPEGVVSLEKLGFKFDFCTLTYFAKLSSKNNKDRGIKKSVSAFYNLKVREIDNDLGIIEKPYEVDIGNMPLMVNGALVMYPSSKQKR
jgi:hypothetical protein